MAWSSPVYPVYFSRDNLLGVRRNIYFLMEAVW